MGITQFAPHHSVRSPRRRFCGQIANSFDQPASRIEAEFTPRSFCRKSYRMLSWKRWLLSHRLRTSGNASSLASFFFWLMILVVGPGGPVNFVANDQSSLGGVHPGRTSITAVEFSCQARERELEIATLAVFRKSF